MMGSPKVRHTSWSKFGLLSDFSLRPGIDNDLLAYVSILGLNLGS